MNTVLTVERVSDKKYKFIISFKNDESVTVFFPFDRLKNSAERVGFCLEKNGKLLEPIELLFVTKKNIKIYC